MHDALKTIIAFL